MKAKKQALFEENRVELYKKLPIDTPMSLIIDPSSACNFKCIYCAQSLGNEFDSRHFQRNIMTYDIFENIVMQLKDFPQKIKKIHLFRSGEPLLNKNIGKMVKKLKEENICENINISTNALLLNRRLSMELIEAGLDCLTISLQGVNSKKYKEIADVEVNFDDFVENIKFFYKNRKNCKLYIKNIDVALDDGDEEKFYEIFETIADRVFIETACPVYPSVDYKDIIKKNDVTRYGEDVGVPDICQISFYHLHILSNGDVLPCSSIDSPIKPWNVSQMKLVDIWESKARIDFLKMQARGERRNNPVCNSCKRLSQELRPEDSLDGHGEYLLNALSGGQNG